MYNTLRNTQTFEETCLVLFKEIKLATKETKEAPSVIAPNMIYTINNKGAALRVIELGSLVVSSTTIKEIKNSTPITTQ